MSQKSDWIGGGVGLLVFLVGLGLLVLTFKQAAELFSIPVSLALGIKPGENLDFSKAGDAVFGLLWRIATLLVMCIVGSVIANRGIKMYQASRHLPPSPRASKGPDQEV